MPVKFKIIAVITVFCIFFNSDLSAETASQSTEYYREGVELFKKKDYLSAEKKFAEAVKYSPYYSLGYYGLGRVYLLDGKKIKDAIKNLRKSVELDRDLARGYFYLGLAEFFSGKNIEAIHSFSSAFEKDRKLVESLYNIGVIYDELGNSYKAFSYYRKYINDLKGSERPF